MATNEAAEILTIWTNRLQLKTLTEADTESLHPLLSNKITMRWTLHGPLHAKSQIAKWLNGKTPGANLLVFAIREQKSHQVSDPIIGVLGSFGHPQCGYLFHPDFFGKGYASESLQAFTREYFERVPSADEDGQDVLVANTEISNFASQRVLEKCGFSRGEVRLGLTEESTGLCEIVVFRMARPGRTLQEMGLGGQSPRPAAHKG